MLILVEDIDLLLKRTMISRMKNKDAFIYLYIYADDAANSEAERKKKKCDPCNDDTANSEKEKKCISITMTWYKLPIVSLVFLYVFFCSKSADKKLLKIDIVIDKKILA